ncbi:uncharacterized protein LOC115450064 [Manduca sexta]|uniref:Uncharacterized protein n=1 Tax=Manduca sexta TaxID=7130 RepID=A0A921ZN90_MANSE|nr:uncharacterized protein LOC115450064 [Manduca sexta]KAG6460284.1 hypothetical protein O3G_MSEX011874 [Manduca sexta]
MADKDISCDHILRPKLILSINEEISKVIGQDYRILPIFEKGLFEYNCKKHYSLENNEYLKCRWKEYKRNIESRVYSPFQFIDIRDYHFYNCRNRLIPSQSLHTKVVFVRKLRPGPGVDAIGQLPIPNELHMKRGVKKIAKESKGRKDNTTTEK